MTTGVRVVSLKVDVPQSIPSDGKYHVVKFPYPDQPYDAWGMHTALQPDGSTVSDWKSDDRSGLIWPSVEGWGTLTSLIYWEAGAYDELRDRYVRNPLDPEAYDSTASEHRPPSPGGQCFHKTHEMFVHPDVPIALLVAQDAGVSRKLTLAEFKLAIQPAEEPAE